ncbi:MAG TPA: hypothetical protein PLY40_07910, partial [Bacillota bacterium]|nr:hypothetical protein [Bacillota bacterium]
MEREQALKDVAVIKSVFEKTNIYFSNQAPYFILWGSLILAASLVQQLFFLAEPAPWAYPLLWIIFVLIGAAGSIIIGKADKVTLPQATNYYSWIFGLLWGSGSLAMAIIVCLSLVLSIYEAKFIMVFIIIITGLVLVATGLFLHRPALYLGVLCFPVSIVMVYFPDWQPSIFGLVTGGGFLVIAMLSLK